MDYKKAILEGLGNLKKLTVKGSEGYKQIENLENHAKSISDQRRLFMMWQSLAEVLNEGITGKAEAPFKVQMKDGSTKKYNTIKQLFGNTERMKMNHPRLRRKQ